MGDLYPTGTIEATDLSPIQPSAVPANVQFIIDDAEQTDWVIPEDHYDYIHTRILEGCFEDMSKVIQTAFKHTKPGGYLESQELNTAPHCDDGTMPPDWPFARYAEKLQDASLQIGRELDIAPKLRGWFEDAGFVDVQQRVFKAPLGQWPRDPAMKDLGHWWNENMVLGLQAFSLAYFSRVLRWSAEEIEVYLMDVRRSLADREVHAYHRMYVVWGRKPEVGEVAPPRAPAAGAAPRAAGAGRE
jgi:metalloendopeptidase OMA1, mitochondrial